MNHRSPEIKKGDFNRLGSLHVHVDGFPDPNKLTELVKKLEEQGFPGKVHRVMNFIEGPQRVELSETYEVHTTGFPGREDFASFSTTLLKSREDVRKVLDLLFQEVPKGIGVVLELEQVYAHVTQDGQWEEVDLESILNLKSNETPLPVRPTFPIEVHHMIDAPHSNNENPVLLKNLLKNKKGGKEIPYGGWFLFKKEDALAYRSNSFSKIEGVREKVLLEYQRLVEHESIKEMRQPIVRTLVERVLGVWRV